MKKFLRELEAILAAADDERRGRILECIRGIVKGLDVVTDYVPISKMAMARLGGDLAMWKSMSQTGPEILTKTRALAKATGPYVDWLFQAL